MRGTGRTTRQIQNMPDGGVFIVTNDMVDYCSKIAAMEGKQILTSYEKSKAGELC